MNVKFDSKIGKFEFTCEFVEEVAALLEIAAKHIKPPEKKVEPVILRRGDYSDSSFSPNILQPPYEITCDSDDYTKEV